jgi:tRNA-2-methylthio-N6-dimethylallyladenosine synthase
MSAKYLYINTIGCQMNVYDSEQIAGHLALLGYQQTASPEAADLIIVNTCTIREKAEQKAYSFLGRLARLKRKKNGLIVGIGGCVAQQDGKQILKRLPFVDIVFGTQAIDRLPGWIRQIEKKRCQIVDVELNAKARAGEPIIGLQGETQSSRFVTIMRGCDNYCAYCVVPFVRGRETSRPPDGIIKEIRSLVSNGVREVTLLGQNVNSYGKKEGLCSFAELLARIDGIEDLLRIRFTTSHPKDLDADLIGSFRHLKKLCRHIHLPVQSGSNQVLKQMNRKYSRELYLDKVSKLRDTSPDIAITSDIIVGFPGETDADFDATLDLVKQVQYDGLFAFKYSDRPNAPALYYPDKVSESRKNERLQILLAMQDAITRKKNQALVGSIQEVLTDGLSKKEISSKLADGRQPVQATGRTFTNKIVNFYLDAEAESSRDIGTGNLLDVRIEKAFAHSLWGKTVVSEPTAKRVKGVDSYAA